MTILIAIGNLLLLLLFPAGKLGPTAVLLPLFLAGASLVCAIIFSALGILYRKRDDPWWKKELITAAIRSGLVGFNILVLKEALYEAYTFINRPFHIRPGL